MDHGVPAPLHHPASDMTSSSSPGRRSLLLPGAVLGSLLLLSGLSAAAPARIISKDCVACHPPVAKQAARKFVHAPFKDQKNCESCHKRHGVVGALVLKEEEPGLCLSCHKEKDLDLKAAHVHAPLKGGKCTSCHLPHSSDSKGLLKASSNELCFQCHKKEPFARASAHKPSAAGCLTCHSPHT